MYHTGQAFAWTAIIFLVSSVRASLFSSKPLVIAHRCIQLHIATHSTGNCHDRLLQRFLCAGDRHVATQKKL